MKRKMVLRFGIAVVVMAAVMAGGYIAIADEEAVASPLDVCVIPGEEELVTPTVWSWSIAIEGVEGVEEFTSIDADNLEMVTIYNATRRGSGKPPRIENWTGVLLKTLMSDHLNVINFSSIEVIASDNFSRTFTPERVNDPENRMLLGLYLEGECIQHDERLAPARLVFDDTWGVYWVRKVATIVVHNMAVNNIFDTREPDNPFPSISGTHDGIIILNHTITATGLYTYAIPGTGGHTRHVRIWNETWNVTTEWDGFTGDWRNISFDEPITLLAGKPYNFTIKTGSYPQIHHTEAEALQTPNGQIECSGFVDVNGREHQGWIPAIRLF